MIHSLGRFCHSKIIWAGEARSTFYSVKLYKYYHFCQLMTYLLTGLLVPYHELLFSPHKLCPYLRLISYLALASG